jgi:virulence-associated protein VapD
VFAIAFDLDTKDTERAHPKGLAQAYTDIRVLLGEYDFEWRQGSVYTSDNENLVNLFDALNALSAVRWLPASVRDIRAFRVEQWSDFTSSMKSRLI